MKNQIRILFAILLCLFISQTKVEGQAVRKAFIPVKATNTEVVAPDVKAPVVKAPVVKAPIVKSSTPTTGAVTTPTATTPAVTAPVAKAPVASKTPAAVVASVSPANLTADEKNAINDIKLYAGMKIDAFIAKMKSQNYEQYSHEKHSTDLYESYSDMAFKSKITGDYIAINGGVRDNDYYVMEVIKTKIMKNPDLQSVKKTFLDYGKQLTDLRTVFKSGEVSEVNGSDNSITANSLPLWNSKCIQELDRFINAKQTGKAYLNYGDAGHKYSISIDCQSGAAFIVVQVTDLSVHSNKG